MFYIQLQVIYELKNEKNYHESLFHKLKECAKVIFVKLVY